MSKVVNIDTRKPPAGNLFDFGSTWMQHQRVWLQGQLRDYMRSEGNTLKALALKTNLSTSTLSNFAYGVTRRPYGTTIDAVIAGLHLYRKNAAQMDAYGASLGEAAEALPTGRGKK